MCVITQFIFHFFFLEMALTSFFYTKDNKSRGKLLTQIPKVNIQAKIAIE